MYLTLRARHLDCEASWVLELSGDADTATLEVLWQGLAHLATRNAGDSVGNVAQLEFCDVAAARLILESLHMTPTTLRGATGSVKRVVDLMNAQKQRPPQTLPPGTSVEAAQAA